MAGKRVAKSSMDWAKFAEMVPKHEHANYINFKGRTDTYVSRLVGLPDSLQSIDFSGYKSRAFGPAIAVVEEFEKRYKSVTVPYPKDKDGLLGQIEKVKTEETARVSEWTKESNVRIAESQKVLDKWAKLPPIEHMVMDEFYHYFPEHSLFHPNAAPSIWPHTAAENDPARVAKQSDYKVPKPEDDH